MSLLRCCTAGSDDAASRCCRCGEWGRERRTEAGWEESRLQSQSEYSRRGLSPSLTLASRLPFPASPSLLTLRSRAAQAAAADALPPLAPAATAAPAAAAPVAVSIALSACHLPPLLDPIACLLQLLPEREHLLAHTEIVRQSSSPHWLQALQADVSAGSSGSSCTVKLAVFDASHISRADSGDGGGRGDELGKGVLSRLLHRASLKRRGGQRRGGRGRGRAAAGQRQRNEREGGRLSDGSGGAARLEASELSSGDLIGCVIVSLAALCASSRHRVTQRLQLRHPFDPDIDRRLSRGNAQLLLTVTPAAAKTAKHDQQQQQQQQQLGSPQLSSLSSRPLPSLSSGPAPLSSASVMPLPAALRLLSAGRCVPQVPLLVPVRARAPPRVLQPAADDGGADGGG